MHDQIVAEAPHGGKAGDSLFSEAREHARKAYFDTHRDRGFHFENTLPDSKLIDADGATVRNRARGNSLMSAQVGRELTAQQHWKANAATLQQAAQAARKIVRLQQERGIRH